MLYDNLQIASTPHIKPWLTVRPRLMLIISQLHHNRLIFLLQQTCAHEGAMFCNITCSGIQQTILLKLEKTCLNAYVKSHVLGAWMNAKVAIVFKKRNKNNIRNYGLIYLIKLLMKILTKRPGRTQAKNQREEPASLRSRNSITEHVHVRKQLKETC